MIPCKECISFAICKTAKFHDCNILLNYYIEVFEQTHITGYINYLFDKTINCNPTFTKHVRYKVYNGGLFNYSISDPKIRKKLADDLYYILYDKDRLTFKLYASRLGKHKRFKYVNISYEFSISNKILSAYINTNIILPNSNSKIRLYL